jgi:hypothetical protein
MLQITSSFALYQQIHEKEKGQFRKGPSSRRNAFNDRKCFECGELGKIAMNCPSKKKKNKYGEDKKKKNYIIRRRMAKLI